ncbi:MAG: ABC transporter permease, partial [Oscillospiraceae bacterium]
WAAYGIMYTTPPIITPFNWKFALIATISFMIVTIGATFMACASELSSVPANLIRPKPPKSGKRVFLERITFIWKHLSFTKKLTARNILRYKKRFFMTVIGIAGCTALMLTGFGLKDSINGIVKNQFENLFHYDMQATFANPINLEKITDKQSEAIRTLETDERITNSMLINQENLTALSGNSSKRMETYLVVPKDIEKVQDFITFRTRKKHKPLEFPTEGAMISEKLSNELKLKIGDEILLENSDNKQFKVKVAGICENYVQNYVYVSPNQYAKTFGEKCEYRGVYGQISDYDTNFTNELATDLMKNTEFLGISYTTTIVETFTNIFDRLDMVVLVLIFSASLLAFVVLYNLTNININERVREIATIKVLGFYDGEVSRYIYRENIVLTIIGTLTGFVMGIFLHQYVMRVAEVNIVMFGRDILPPSFLWAGLLTILFGLLVNFVMHFRLKRINMVESLKSIE